MVKHRFEDKTQIRRLLKMMLEEMIKENTEIMAKYYTEEECIKREKRYMETEQNLLEKNANLKREIEDLKAKLHLNQQYNK